MALNGLEVFLTSLRGLLDNNALAGTVNVFCGHPDCGKYGIQLGVSFRIGETDEIVPVLVHVLGADEPVCYPCYRKHFGGEVEDYVSYLVREHGFGPGELPVLKPSRLDFIARPEGLAFREPTRRKSPPTRPQVVVPPPPRPPARTEHSRVVVPPKPPSREVAVVVPPPREVHPGIVVPPARRSEPSPVMVQPPKPSAERPPERVLACKPIELPQAPRPVPPPIVVPRASGPAAKPPSRSVVVPPQRSQSLPVGCVVPPRIAPSQPPRGPDVREPTRTHPSATPRGFGVGEKVVTRFGDILGKAGLSVPTEQEAKQKGAAKRLGDKARQEAEDAKWLASIVERGQYGAIPVLAEIGKEVPIAVIEGKPVFYQDADARAVCMGGDEPRRFVGTLESGGEPVKFILTPEMRESGWTTQSAILSGAEKEFRSAVSDGEKTTRIVLPLGAKTTWLLGPETRRTFADEIVHAMKTAVLPSRPHDGLVMETDVSRTEDGSDTHAP